MNDITEVLSSVFKLKGFRRGQSEIISSVLSGDDTLAVMPTGGGKSLCYQLPAQMKSGTVIVVSPLISLMRDQIEALKAKGFKAGCLHSGQSLEEKREVFRSMSASPNFLLYLSPERVQKDGFARWVKTARVSLFAIDEAHCVSQWGPDFREDYFKLSLLRDLRPEIPILALTATATPEVLNDIGRSLGLRKPQKHVYGFYRPNLYYQVELCRDDREKTQILQTALRKFQDGRVIIYCGTRKKCEDLSELFSREFKNAGYYHAGLNAEERNEIQDQFQKSKIKFLFATNAFGMGVDIPDVRLVVHYQMPSNLDSYYQEVGRAGRDGENSTCVLLYSKKDKGLQSHFILQSRAPRNILDQRWRSLETIVQYAEGGECRHSGILTYFKDTQRIKTCGHCDVCDSKSERKVIYEAQAEEAPRKIDKLTKKKAKPDATPLNSNELLRREMIKDWRYDYAKTRDIPAFLVFSNKTMDDLARKNPKTLDSLLKVYGLGPQKVETFGRELLELLVHV